MTLNSLGDLTHSFLFRRQSVALKTDMQRLSQEVTTGLASDTGAHLSGNLAPLASIENSLSRLQGHSSVTTELQGVASAMQTTLTAINDISSQLSSQLLGATEGAVSAQVDAAGADAAQKFASVVGLLNTRFGDRTLFAGVEGSGPALADADTLMASLQTAVSGAVSAEDIATAVDNWMSDPSGFSATGYLGGAPLTAVSIAPSEQTQLSITAADPAIRATLKGLAMAALLDKGVLAGNPTARKDLAQAAGSSLLDSSQDRANLQGHLGSIESQISQAVSRNGAETTALNIARNDLLSVDPYETATRLQNTQTQLETVYALTARLSRLSLVDYLK